MPPEGNQGQPANLTRKQMGVLTLRAGGMSERDVSGRLNISVKGVENHITRVFSNLGASSIT